MNTHCCNGESQRPTKGFENEGPVHTELKSQGRNNVETHRFQPRIFLTVSVVLQLCDELRIVCKQEGIESEVETDFPRGIERRAPRLTVNMTCPSTPPFTANGRRLHPLSRVGAGYQDPRFEPVPLRGVLQALR